MKRKEEAIHLTDEQVKEMANIKVNSFKLLFFLSQFFGGLLLVAMILGLAVLIKLLIGVLF